VCVLFNHKLYRLVIHKQQFDHKEKPGSRDKLCDEVMDELIFFMVDLFSSGYNSPKPTKHLNQKNGQETFQASLFTVVFEPKQLGPFAQEQRKQVSCCDGYAIEEKSPVFYLYLLNFRDCIHDDEIYPHIFESMACIPERNVLFI